ncbi:MAG: ATP-grasp domain-containing protein [Candidatus Roizmanbacteria bacterium]
MKIATLPQDLDGLFYTKQDMYFVVQKDSSLAEWMVSIWNEDHLIQYSYPELVEIDYDNEVEEIFEKSNLIFLLKEHNIHSFFCTRLLSPRLIDIAKKNTIRLVSTSHLLQEKFNDKVWFDTFLLTNGFPSPKKLSCSSMDEMRNIQYPYVIQKKISDGAEGTYIIKNNVNFQKIVEIIKNEKLSNLLIREYIDGGAYGISITISNDDVSLSSIRRQCYTQEGHFIGVQWVSTKSLSSKLSKNINQLFCRLGAVLYDANFRGYANIDFMIDSNEEVYIIECNPRCSAATLFLPFEKSITETNHEDILWSALLDPIDKKQYTIHHMPQSSFEGALLHIDFDPARIKKVQKVEKMGTYDFKNSFHILNTDIFSLSKSNPIYFFITEAMMNEEYDTSTTLGYIISNRSLFNSEGNLNAIGIKTLHFFNYE